MRLHSLAITLVLVIVLLVSVMASVAKTCLNIERFAADRSSSSSTQSVDAYMSARAALLPPPKVTGGDRGAYLEDPLPGNTHSTRSRAAWTYAIRESRKEDSRKEVSRKEVSRKEVSRKVYVADDAAAVLRSVSVQGSAWEAVPVSSDADTYPATVSAIRTIVADAFRGDGDRHSKGVPQLARALIEGLWRPRPASDSLNADGVGGELWRVLACFATGNDTAAGRCFLMDVLVHRPMRLQGPPGRLLFASNIGVLDGGVLSQPQTQPQA